MVLQLASVADAASDERWFMKPIAPPNKALNLPMSEAQKWSDEFEQ